MHSSSRIKFSIGNIELECPAELIDRTTKQPIQIGVEDNEGIVVEADRFLDEISTTPADSKDSEIELLPLRFSHTTDIHRQAYFAQLPVTSNETAAERIKRLAAPLAPEDKKRIQTKAKEKGRKIIGDGFDIELAALPTRNAHAHEISIPEIKAEAEPLHNYQFSAANLYFWSFVATALFAGMILSKSGQEDKVKAGMGVALMNCLGSMLSSLMQLGFSKRNHPEINPLTYLTGSHIKIIIGLGQLAGYAMFAMSLEIPLLAALAITIGAGTLGRTIMAKPIEKVFNCLSQCSTSLFSCRNRTSGPTDRTPLISRNFTADAINEAVRTSAMHPTR